MQKCMHKEFTNWSSSPLHFTPQSSILAFFSSTFPVFLILSLSLFSISNTFLADISFLPAIWHLFPASPHVGTTPVLAIITWSLLLSIFNLLEDENKAKDNQRVIIIKGYWNSFVRHHFHSAGCGDWVMVTGGQREDLQGVEHKLSSKLCLG